MFTREDLCSLRRAVYEGGSLVVGGYKCFDARVLAAINDALGDTRSIYVLNEPKNTQSLNAKVSCVREGDLFRLHGHATFDIVFGWGCAGVEQDAPWSVHLTPATRETLATSVEMLGWDPRRRQDKRLRPAWNALYGLPVGWDTSEVRPHPGPELEVGVAFQGPFSALYDADCRCLFTDPVAGRGGVYLWTVNADGADRPWYVGQTQRGFGQRTAEHLTSMLSGQYSVLDPAALLRGEYRLAEGAVVPNWPLTLPGHLRNWEKLMPNIMAVIRLVRFHVAPLTGDAHLYDRVEGAIGRYYKVHRDAALRNSFTPGLKLPAAIPGDQPIRLVLSSESPIGGLPSQLRE